MRKMIACLAVQAVLAGASFAQQPPTGPQSAPNPAPQPAPPSPSAPGAAPQSAPPTAPTSALASQAPGLNGLELKAALCKIDVILSPMDGVPVPAAEATLCQPFFSIENVPTYISAGGKVLEFGALSNSLRAYYEFRSLAFGGPQQCAPLASLQAQAEKAVGASMTTRSNWESNCRTHVNEIRFVQALVMHDPKAAALCQAWDASDPDKDGGSRASESAELCAKAAAASDLKAFGESVCNGDPKGKRKCTDFFASIAGDPSGCRGGSAEAVSHRVLCRGYVAFAKAGPAKNPELCGDNLVCVAMTGGAVRATVDAQTAVAADLGRVLLPEVQSRLKALVAAVNPLDAAAAKEIDARAERIARLRLKVDPQSRKGGAPSKKGASNAQEEQ